MIYEASTQTFILAHLGECGCAILEREDGQRFTVPADWLPEGVGQQDVLALRQKIAGSDCNLRLFIKQKAKQDQASEASHDAATAIAAA